MRVVRSKVFDCTWRIGSGIIAASIQYNREISALLHILASINIACRQDQDVDQAFIATRNIKQDRHWMAQARMHRPKVVK